MTTIIRGAEWNLGAETTPGAPEAIYVVECVACHDQSDPVDNDRLEVEMWALKHTGRNTSHRLFKLKTETFWRVSPVPGNPLYEGEHPA
ncbi:hypothetical protein ABZ746_15035 [Streptomyces sp. NPDC020096]